jgi:hypothetical protein
MSQLTSESRFIIQPNPERTLNDPGTIDFTVPLTRNQRQGLATMAEVLFTNRTTGQLVPELGSHLLVFISDTFDEFVTHLHSYVSFVNGVAWRRLQDSRLPWTQEIFNSNIVRVSRTRQQLNRRLDPYTAILHSYYHRDDGYIVEFTDPEFLQGAITACQWFGLNWRNYITDIHHNDQLMEATNV